MADPKDMPISYDEVVSAAQSILKKGERYTLEKIRRVLGKGSHSKIAEHLRQWQIVKASRQKTSNISNNKNLKRNQRSTSSWKQRAHSAHEAVITKKPSQPFSMDRFSKEPMVIRSLFCSILYTKESRAFALDERQRFQQNVVDMSRDADKKVVELKKKNRLEINKLMEEHARLRNQLDKEMYSLRESSLGG
jgi:hypothetical protein